MDPLQVDVLYFYPKENSEDHHTNRFEAVNDESPTTTIVRRGQTFSGVIRFNNRPFDESQDIVQFVFNLGDRPRHETQGAFILQGDAEPDAFLWTGKILAADNDTVSFQICTPVNAPVGSWSVRVVTRLKTSPARAVYEFDQDFFILFNPWNGADNTFMEDTPLLEEYVLNDVGKVWVGPIRTCRGRHWLYGQFDRVVLPACMFVLDRANVPFEHRGDPIRVTRAISRIVNSNDDQGVLIGRWDGEYGDGTAPAAWPGSVDILQQYLETQAEVPYGQCWVFAGVVTTICRALGIPSRVVSNLVSAHDANGTLTVDKYYSENMDEIEGDPANENGGADSIWNYHVWNDVWMTRPDLPPGYGGWQAIDATPQELSMGQYQCGPAPLEAIKQGVAGLGYDVDFMLASVNADLMRWRRCPDSPAGYAMVDSNKYHIGRQVITKKPYVFDPIGDEDREDITELYKYREGTDMERMALYNGVRHSERAKRYFQIAESKQNEVEFLMQEIDAINVGEPFRVVVDITNNSAEDRNVKAVLMATSVFYNGVKADVVKRAEGTILVSSGNKEQLNLTVEVEEYIPKLVEYSNLKISAMCIVEETKQSWADDDDFQVMKPNISIKVNDDLLVGQAATALLTFGNPLHIPLTDCRIMLTGVGIAGRTLRAAHDDVEPRGAVVAEIPIEPTRAGKLTLIATFNSAELKDVTGAATLEAFEE